MTGQAAAEVHPVSRRALWFGLLGGGAAWTFHLIAAWAVAEFGCVATRPGGIGIGSPPMVLLVVVSVVGLGAAVAATWVAYRSDRALRGVEGGADPTELFMARTGLITSSVFVFVVATQILPLFYFVSAC
jgi:hypothetical protein